MTFLVFDIGVLQRPPPLPASRQEIPKERDRYELETNKVLSEHDFHEFYPLLKISLRTKFYTNLRSPRICHDGRELPKDHCRYHRYSCYYKQGVYLFPYYSNSIHQSGKKFRDG